MIEVTAAVIKDGDNILICQRPKGKRFADMWEFPGGKVEQGETLEQCVVRECKEELDVIISIDSFLTDIVKDDLHISFFVCHIKCGTTVLKEHQALKWITKAELADYVFCPADTDAVDMLKEL